MSKNKKVIPVVLEEKKIAIEKPSLFDQWKESSVPCRYVRFQAPVPPCVNKEPVYEFKIEPKDVKYKVDAMLYNPSVGLIFSAYGEEDIVPCPNIQYIRIRCK